MNEHLAQFVRQHRKRRGLSQTALAKKCELCLATVRRIEKGYPARPESLSSLARALEVPFEEIARAAEWSGPVPEASPLERRAPADEPEPELTIVIKGPLLERILKILEK